MVLDVCLLKVVLGLHPELTAGSKISRKKEPGKWPRRQGCTGEGWEQEDSRNTEIFGPQGGNSTNFAASSVTRII